MSCFDSIFSRDHRSLVGVVHLRPLPGSARAAQDASNIGPMAMADAQAYVAGGAAGIIVENFGDAPFAASAVGPEVVAHMTRVAGDLMQVGLPLGINVLRNDGVAALAVASAVGAAFIRVNVLCGARVADQGVIEGIAHRLLKARRAMGAESVAIMADVNVKHSAPIGPYDVADEAADAIKRGGADGVIVTGSATGSGADPSELERVRSAIGDARVWVGSGVTEQNVATFAAADGFIVGSSLKVDGCVDQPVDMDRVRAMVNAVARIPART
jgi:membrane complex biogenesis BtpA family protein